MIFREGMPIQILVFYLLTSGEYYSYQRGMSSVSGVSCMKNCLCAKSNSMIDFYHFFLASLIVSNFSMKFFAKAGEESTILQKYSFMASHSALVNLSWLRYSEF